MEVFLGEFFYKMDEKGRLPLPRKLIAGLSEGMTYISISPDGCLILFPARTWTKTKKNMGRLFQPEEIRIKKRKNGWEILIPKNLREHLGREVAIAGCKDYIELWRKNKWILAKEEAGKELVAMFV